MAAATKGEPQFREVRVHSSRELSPTVRSLLLETADGGELTWACGQYVELLVPEHLLADAPEAQAPGDEWLDEVKAAKRPFSIASAPDPRSPGLVELAVGTGEGEGDSVSSLLKRLPKGVRLGLLGPLGEFTRAGLCDEPAVFIATGTGVAPLRAMIQKDLDRRENGPDLVLLFGCRSERDLLWDDEFRELAARHPRFHYEPTLSQPTDAWPGRRGYVQDHVAEIVRARGPIPVFVAGHSPMVADVLRILEIDLAHPQDRILREQYV